MVKNIKEVKEKNSYLEEQGYKDLKKRLLISLIIIVIAVILFIIIYFFYYAKPCNDSACFSNSMTKCSRVYFIKEDSKASWYYEIKGTSGKDSCSVLVRLLKMNAGDIDTETLQGSEMTCIVNKADTSAPEENMKSCNGLLKEKLQEIIIDRMHSYLLQNLGEIKQSFGP